MRQEICCAVCVKCWAGGSSTAKDFGEPIPPERAIDGGGSPYWLVPSNSSSLSLTCIILSSILTAVRRGTSVSPTLLKCNAESYASLARAALRRALRGSLVEAAILQNVLARSNSER